MTRVQFAALTILMIFASALICPKMSPTEKMLLMIFSFGLYLVAVGVYCSKKEGK